MHAHIRVPPDSTGKRIHGREFVDLNYSSLTGTLVSGATITFTTSGVIGTISKWEVATGTTGQMHVWVSADSAEVDVTVGEGFTFTSSSGSGTGVVDSATRFFDQSSIITGKNIDSWLDIDDRGAAFVTFTEGQPTLAPFGQVRVGRGNTVGVYDFTTDGADELFSDSTTTGGTITHDPDTSSVSLAVTTSNGSSAKRISDKYHFYWPGNGNLTMMTIALSDATMVGCERRWGYFDNEDGMYFLLDDANLKLVLRSSVSGSVVETVLPRTDWNGDKLDGSGTSKMVLDLTKVNVYWIDMQCGGTVRMGVLDDHGNRIICHRWLNANANIYPYMKSGSLPIQYSILNTSATGGAASIRMTWCTVHTEGLIDYTYWRYSYSSGTKSVTGSNVPVLSVRSKPTWSGKHNVTTSYPDKISIYVGGTGAAKIDLYWDYLTFTGATYANDNGSTVEADTAASAVTISGPVPMHTFYVTPGVHTIDISSIFETNDVAINAKADETDSMPICFIASNITGSPTVDLSLTYRELR